MNKLTRALDKISYRFSQIASSMTLILVFIVVSDVFLRYFFKAGSIKLQELEWHVHALVFLLGAAHVLKENQHVRVDIFYNRYSPRVKAAVDLFACLFFLIPFSIVCIKTSWPLAVTSFKIAESSADPGGLPYRFLIKGAISFGFLLLLLQGLSETVKNAGTLFCRKNNKEELC